MPVKREVDGDDAVPDDWLREPEHLAQAEKVDRLAADYEMVTSLAWAGFEGRDYEYFATELARYGMAVIRGWLRRGLIFERCQSRGYGGLPAIGRPFTDDEIEELTNETVAKALQHFRGDVLMKKKWDYRKGATLRTYFVGQCLIRFANIYRRWWGCEQRNRHAPTNDIELLDDLHLRSAGPEGSAVDYRAAVEALRSVKDERVKKAMVLSAAGRSQAEIAEHLKVTPKAVERMLANERARQRDRRAG